MGAMVWLVSLAKLNSAVTLIIQIPLGIVIYLIGSKLLKLESYEYLIEIIKSFIKK